uniref:Uncharacterized protein n=1 Tax=Chenopodium quinoa TaxID=63459 RepID=A0A803N4M6_CHEQI
MPPLKTHESLKEVGKNKMMNRRALALQTLLKEVNVGEESYKTPIKVKSSVAISFEIEEVANVEVSLTPPNVGMVFDSWQKIDLYFRNYGKQEGFEVVRSSGANIGRGSNAKEKRSVTWTCECYELKVLCPVKLYVKVNELRLHGQDFTRAQALKKNSRALQEEKSLYWGDNVCSGEHLHLPEHPLLFPSESVVHRRDSEVVMQTLKLVNMQLEKKISMLAKKGGQGGVVGTTSFVCGEKESTPSTHRQRSCDGGEDDVDHVKYPPIPKRPSHRTTGSRYKSCLEKPKKARTTKNTQAKNNNGSQSEVTPPEVVK